MQIQKAYTSPKLYQFHFVSIYYSTHKFIISGTALWKWSWLGLWVFIEPLFTQVIHLKHNVSFMRETCYYCYHTSWWDSPINPNMMPLSVSRKLMKIKIQDFNPTEFLLENFLSFLWLFHYFLCCKSRSNKLWCADITVPFWSIFFYNDKIT